VRDSRRPGISRETGEWQFTFGHCGGRVLERGEDVLAFEILVVDKDLTIARPAARGPTTAFTVTRMPRMHGSPPIRSGSTVMRSNTMT